MEFVTFLIQALFVIIALAVVFFWVLQFAQLMALSDADFPGRHDKTLWVIAFLVLNIFAALAFVWWRAIMVGVRAAQRDKTAK